MTGRLLLLDLIVQLAFALLAGPLQLPREKPRVVVRLQAVTACQDVHCHLSRREPEATVRHRGQTNADAPRSTRQVIFRLNSRGQHQLLAELLAGLLLLLLFLLLLKTSHAAKHRLEERRQGFHHLALVPRDVEINGECLLESYLETLHDGLVFCLQGSAGVEPFLFVTAVCWRAWCLCYSWSLLSEPSSLGHINRPQLRLLWNLSCLYGSAHQELEVDIATVAHLRDVVGRAPEGLVPFHLAATPLVTVVRVIYKSLLHERLAASTHALEATANL